MIPNLKLQYQKESELLLMLVILIQGFEVDMEKNASLSWLSFKVPLFLLILKFGMGFTAITCKKQRNLAKKRDKVIWLLYRSFLYE